MLFKKSTFFIRLLHWEYWSTYIIYAPIYIYFVWLCIKARSFFFFNAANPSIKNGGFLMESKQAIDAILPQSLIPKTIYFQPYTDFKIILQQIKEHQFTYPLIIKPDIGLQGKSVVLINDSEALLKAVQAFRVAFLIQEFINYENEIGIFYVRYPNQPKGKITGIVHKEFVHVVGNGYDTIEILLFQNPRYILQRAALKKLVPIAVMQAVPAVDEKKIILPYGNHARGCLFTDATVLTDEALLNVIDSVAKQINNFYYGRFDIKFKSWEDLTENRNWKIIELNGAGSEPTHIYDPKHSIFFAWKEIIRHWKILYEIAVINKKFGYPYLTFKEGKEMYKQNNLYMKKITH
jgi:hypothetical protein